MSTHQLGLPTNNPLPHSKEETPISEPLLISSIQLRPPSDVSNQADQHLLLVDKVLDYLSQKDQRVEFMEEMASEDSGSLPKCDDDMILYHYQEDIKLEALARREPSKNGMKSKKGRSSLHS